MNNFIIRSIRAKLIFWICILFLFMGALIYFPLSKILPQKIASQILKRDVQIAGYLSDEAKNFLLLNDKIGLSLLLHDNQSKLEDAEYLFIQAPNGNITAHTFGDGFPKGLLSFRPDSQYSHSIKEFLSDKRKIYDIAVPILNGEMGTLHLGVSMESGKQDIAEIAKINYYVAAIILMGLGIGVLVFLAIGLLFSNQIIKLKNFTSKVGKGDLEAKIDIKSKDEIGALALAFNEMVLRLKGNIEKVKRLNTIDERNRIALDLHDGCAQEMANTIKRLELCEKLFKINPQKAFKELELLKESTKDMLYRTRKVIFDIKSHEDFDFNLLEKLRGYIIDYKLENDIEVRLNISNPTNNIQPDKSKSMFYIITEALANIKKHSRAKTVEVNLKTDEDNNLIIDIKDDGRGFDANAARLSSLKKGRLGLISMRQRARTLGGTFTLESKPDEGTRISVNIPLAGAVT